MPERHTRFQWWKFVIVPLVLGAFTLLGIYIQQKRAEHNDKAEAKDYAIQNNSDGNQTNFNNTSNGTINTNLNSGSGVLLSSVNSGIGHQNNFFSSKIFQLNKLQKRAIIEVDERMPVQVVDTGIIKSFRFTFKNNGTLPAVNYSLSTFVLYVKKNKTYPMDTIPMINKDDTLDQGVSRVLHYDLKKEELNDTLIFYIKLRYADKTKIYSPKPFIFLFPPNRFNKGLDFLDYNNSNTIAATLKKYGG